MGPRALLTGLFALGLAAAAARDVARADRAAAVMAEAANAFLAGLDEAQRAKASFTFDSPVRTDWHFVPRERQGLALGDLSAPERAKLDALLDSGFSARGHAKLDGVLKLEGLLREKEGAWRDPAKYHVAIFGKPGTDPWGWRLEGHHFTAHFTSVDKDVIAVTPNFVGANPARTESGGAAFELLGAEDDAARELVASLSDAERDRARLAGATPQDVLLDPSKSKLDGEPAGIGAPALDASKRALLLAIVDSYFADLSSDLAARERARFAAHPITELHFAWAGDKPGAKPWYWRVQGSYFAIEFVYPRGEVNHAHRIWRDFERDLGGDPLREHLAKER